MNQKLVTNEEMSALLPESGKSKNGGDRDKSMRVVPYNFRRPDRLSKEQIRSLYLLHDVFARHLSAQLPLFLRAVCEITLLSVEQTSFSDYQRSLPDPSPIFTVGMQPLNGLAAIQLHSSIAFPVIDRLLGGQGENLNETRQATEIEMKVLEEFINPVLDAWKEAWRPLIDLKMQIIGFETRPQMLQPVASNEIIVSIGLQVQIGESNGSISLCLPVVMLEPVIEKFNQSSYSSTRETDPEQTAALLNKLSQVKFPASAQLTPAKISTGVLLSLTEGDVLRTNHHIEQPLQINYGGKIKFAGRLASRENRVIIQIHEEND